MATNLGRRAARCRGGERAHDIRATRRHSSALGCRVSTGPYRRRRRQPAVGLVRRLITERRCVRGGQGRGRCAGVVSNAPTSAAQADASNAAQADASSAAQTDISSAAEAKPTRLAEADDCLRTDW